MTYCNNNSFFSRQTLCECVENDDNPSRFTGQNSEQPLLTANQREFDGSSIEHLQSIELVLTRSCSVDDCQSFISNYS